MRFSTWKSETERGILKPRSTELKRLDDAIRACAQGDTAHATPPQRTAVANALRAWADAQARKGSSWVRSTRNATVDMHNQGTVERLMRELSRDAACATTLRPYLNAVAAPPPPAYPPPPPPPLSPPPPAYAPPPPPVDPNAYAPGKWERKPDRDGDWHEFIRQEKGNSCVCATIVMVKRAFHSLSAGTLSEEEIRGVMVLQERKLLNTGLSPIDSDLLPMHDWASAGTGPENAVAVLKATPRPVRGARIHPAKVGQALLDDLRRCTKSKPGLIGWYWNAGGGHFTMCAGPTKDKSKLIIVDPWYGIDYVDNTLAGFTSYRNGTGRLEVAILCT